MAAPTLGQHGSNSTIVSNAITLSATGLTDGSTLIIGVGQSTNDVDQTYSVSDGVNSYSTAVGPVYSSGANGGRAVVIFYASNIITSGGSLSVVVTRANGTATFRAQWVEALGAHLSAPLDVFGSSVESADGTSHTCASGGITTASDVFVYSVSVGNSTFGTTTETSSPAFTSIEADWGNGAWFSQYYSNTTGLSANTVAWSSSSSRTAANAVASFIGASGGGGGEIAKANGLLLRGVG